MWLEDENHFIALVADFFSLPQNNNIKKLDINIKKLEQIAPVADWHMLSMLETLSSTLGARWVKY